MVDLNCSIVPYYMKPDPPPCDGYKTDKVKHKNKIMSEPSQT